MVAGQGEFAPFDRHSDGGYEANGDLEACWREELSLGRFVPVVREVRGRPVAREIATAGRARILFRTARIRRPATLQSPEEAPMRRSPPRRPRSRSDLRPGPWTGVSLVVLAAAAWAACGGGHSLAEYDFAGGTLGLVDLGTPRPVLVTGDVDVDTEEGALETVLDAGSRVAKEASARKARARLDSAARRVDTGRLMADHILERGSQYLGTRPVESEAEADYLLELDVRNYGIDARSGRDARLFVVADVILLERRTGREIWSTEVRGRDRLVPSVEGVDLPSDIFTAAGLTQISVDEFERILRGLADVSATAVTDQLREDLRDARRSG